MAAITLTCYRPESSISEFNPAYTVACSKQLFSKDIDESSVFKYIHGEWVLFADPQFSSVAISPSGDYRLIVDGVITEGGHLNALVTDSILLIYSNTGATPVDGIIYICDGVLYNETTRQRFWKL